MKKKTNNLERVDFSPISEIMMELEMWMPKMMDQGKKYTWFEESEFKKYISNREKAIKEKIYKDLIKIANKGECEELRREVEHYFK